MSMALGPREPLHSQFNLPSRHGVEIGIGIDPFHAQFLLIPLPDSDGASDPDQAVEGLAQRFLRGA